MTREQAKELFRNDKDSYEKTKNVMKKIDKIFDDFDEEKNKIFEALENIEKKLDQIVNKQSENLDQEQNYCLHDNCIYCGGTGSKFDGSGMCIHFISCQCKKCSPTFLKNGN